MKPNQIVIVPESHWDREWYLPFQEYRARLVLMIDRLLEIFRTDPEYKNFTMDGQVIPIEDYLEVRPQYEDQIKKYVKEGRLSIGPMYILPDEFIISGESMIRNLILGHQISLKYGNVMKAGYIPDPFGHIAQLPQILSGCEVPSMLFARGFGNEYEEMELNMEFEWQAPGNSASVLGIHLVKGYGSVSNLNTAKKEGTYPYALKTINRAIRQISKHTASPVLLLNSGTDHHEARSEIPEIIKQWNDKNPDMPMVQRDFEYYISKVEESKSTLKRFQGELRGGKYGNLLSGVFSARMWIKQRNTTIEYLFEKYSEPISAITWALDNTNRFIYPDGYLRTGLKWMIKNHPHDSICGCSIDEVHNEMRTRYDWAEQIGNEIYKDSCVFLSELIKDEINPEGKKRVIVYNPLPWKRKGVVKFYIVIRHSDSPTYPKDLKIIDNKGKDISYQTVLTELPSRYNHEGIFSGYLTSIVDDFPACGYKLYYIVPNEKAMETFDEAEFKISENSMENKFYEINVDSKGIISCKDKESNVVYKNICQLEDVGDWGDEYDYSGPKPNQEDLIITSQDAKEVKISKCIDGQTQKSLKINYSLNIPEALTDDRQSRSKNLIKNRIEIIIILYKTIKRVDFEIKLNNVSKDHRIRALFPSKIVTDRVYADGHFYIVPRNIELPDGKKWAQAPLPTNHQKDFVAVMEDKNMVGVLNKGLPEYQPIENDDGSITFAITLLRCNEWLSRGDIATRKGNAGPAVNTPGAQELGVHLSELSFLTVIGANDLLESKIQIRGKEFNNPLRLVSPMMVKSQMRMDDKVIVIPNVELIMRSTRFSEVEKEKYLPSELSFLEINNTNVMLSILKKSEVDDDLIIRCYNLAATTQNAKLKLTDFVKVSKVEIVNLLEAPPIRPIKANQTLNGNIIDLTLEPHVIATLRIEIKKGEV